MKTMRNVPAALIENDGENAGLPHGGGVGLVVLGSVLFWAALIWVILAHH